MKKEELKKINKEIKSYLNEASGISQKCRTQLIKLVEKYFYVELPKENYLNIDIMILENGNIIMRDEEYKTSNELSNSNDLVNRYSDFKKEVEDLLNKNETNFENKKQIKEIENLIILSLIFILVLIVLIYAIRKLFLGDLFGLLWLFIIIMYYIVPLTGTKLRNRIIRAKKFIKNKFTNK